MTATPLPDRLRALQAHLGKSNPQMARQFHVERGAWMKWKAGRKPSRVSLAAINDALRRAKL